MGHSNLPFPLPTELLLHICDQVDSPDDLFSLAKASKQFFPIIIPAHLDYTHICCDLLRTSLWNHLINEPLVSAHCQTLEIVTERRHYQNKVLVPPNADFATDKAVCNENELKKSSSYLEGLKLLPLVIKAMPNLKTLAWRSPRNPTEKIYAAIMYGSIYLNSLSMKLLDVPFETPSFGNIGLTTAPHWRLSNITQFAFSEDDKKTFKTHSLVLSTILRALPALVDLYIIRSYLGQLNMFESEVDQVFQTMTWPNLRRLTVEEACLVAAHERFFRDHSGLEKLCIQTPFADGPGRISFDNLPQLKSLDVTWLPSPEHLSTEVGLRLTYLGIKLPEDYLKLGLEIESLLRKTPNLTVLIVRRMMPMSASILANVPHVERLALLWHIPDHPRSCDDLIAKHDTFRRELFAFLPRITHFSSVRHDLWPSREALRLLIARAGPDEEYAHGLRPLCLLSQSLQFVHVTSSSKDEENGGLWLLIRRSGNGQYSGCSPQLEPRPGNPRSWGGFFVQ